ncbi:MAG TPA: hypothetical protein PKD72_07555, partial [Gemmatales bacterium]|nr:hypothetical protein [Gemmatales bacterium]
NKDNTIATVVIGKDSGPVKIKWISIVPNTSPSGGNTNRVYFQASEDSGSESLNRYFELSGHSDWVKVLSEALDNNTNIEFTEDSGRPIGYSKEESFIMGGSIILPVSEMNIHTPATNIKHTT